MGGERSALTAGDMLTLPELRALRQTSALRGAGLVLHAWAVVAAAMLVYAARPSALTLVVAVVVIGARQLGLAVLMHEASHWLLLPHQRTNTRVGAWLCHWQLYLWLWVLPLATWYQLASRIREMAEHGLVPDRDDPLRNTRTTVAGHLARAILAPYWVNYHLEHHLLVFVPCWRLPAAHALLLDKGHGPGMTVAPGYADVIRRLTTERIAS